MKKRPRPDEGPTELVDSKQFKQIAQLTKEELEIIINTKPTDLSPKSVLRMMVRRPLLRFLRWLGR